MGQKEIPLQTIETNFKITEALRQIGQGTISEVAEHTGLPASTIHVHLNTLRELEYITKDGSEYAIGLHFLKFAESAKRENQLLEAAKSELQELADNTGEVAHLMIEEHGLGIHVFSVSGDNAVPLDTYVGKRIHLHQTGRGKAILAFMLEERRDQIVKDRGLPAATENTITDQQELKNELDKIRQQGYAIDRGERIKGLGCVSAPVTDADGYSVGAISIAGPLSRLQGDYLTEELSMTVLNAANVIEFNLNYS
ncbi:IclR family transcriptional regulator [Natrinema gelatinilyticum]|uniref:IclR family transcriptional regulator n=1 Tax=Natrinema gelatinilyticum TaxID=2961571 RepID=UPI0020C2957F|nr:IclR family transcriptional regulator [Natrinema gelatinilyticum]